VTDGVSTTVAMEFVSQLQIYPRPLLEYYPLSIKTVVVSHSTMLSTGMARRSQYHKPSLKRLS